MNKEKLASIQLSPDIVAREIYVHLRLKHENIIDLYNAKEDNENYYMLMEYANGGSLFKKIKSSKIGFDENEAFKLFIQASSAICFLHENGLVHRDIKPENFLLVNDKLKLCDFGWCRDVAEGERRTFCGTYEYMAPEIVKSDSYGFGIDVWALGILLYELIHNYSPFGIRDNKKFKNEDEEYEEICKNIIKYNIKFEKNISSNLKSLIESKIIL